jgi:uncharacterized membrane protein
MKKTILTMLMVVTVVSPCFAQEIKPATFLSLENTYWFLRGRYLLL